MNILNGLLFLQWKLLHRCSTGLYIGLWNIENFSVKLRWSRSSLLLQRVASLVVFCFEFSLVVLCYRAESNVIYLGPVLVPSAILLTDFRFKFFRCSVISWLYISNSQMFRGINLTRLKVSFQNLCNFKYFSISKII